MTGSLRRKWIAVTVGAALIGVIAATLELMGNLPNPALAAIPDQGGVIGGPGPFGQGAVIVGILFCSAVGLLMRSRTA